MAVQPDATQRARQGYTVRALYPPICAAFPIVGATVGAAPDRVICAAARVVIERRWVQDLARISLAKAVP